MSRNDDIRRELGMGMPTPARDIASERYSVTTKSHVKPEPKQMTFKIALGTVMVNDGNGWRAATAEEIEQMTGGVMGYRHPQDAELLCGIVMEPDPVANERATGGGHAPYKGTEVVIHRLRPDGAVEVTEMTVDSEGGDPD